MLIRLEVDYINDYVFWPIYSLEGKLLAVEMVNRFNSLSGNLSMPADIFFNMLTLSQQHELIKENINFIKNKADWFTHNHILLVLKANDEIVNFLMKAETIRNDINRLSFVHLEINELFPHLSQGKENAYLLNLSQSFNLWLDNFGSGKANLKPLHDGLINTVKIDPNLMEHLLSQSANTLIMEPLLRIIKNYYPGVMIIAKGIDTADYLSKARHLSIDAVQGNLWPAVHFDEIKTQVNFFP
ncbi:diguanylate phosphodiesterase [Brenneria alni]|uniref:Diguanylate phosphodiesterase n=1 Tax=Brenneria alni TaxID=71656 RepID=A0A421DS27_9GAMM|nr:EAL domain-containing protein [Brenneria alni]RLM27061.1 diguanylate phosphodiesterase [Brenneria alni]